MNGAKRNAYRVWVGKAKGRKPLGRCRHRWEDNIKMDLNKMGWQDMDRVNLTQDMDKWRVRENTALKLWGI
jgi:hypothetical protein